MIRRMAGQLYDLIPGKSIMLRPLRSLGLPQRLYQHLHFTGVFTVATPGRTFRVMHYGNEIENELFWEGLPGRRERMSMSLWMRLAPLARVILDIGANSGVYSLVAAAINPRSTVYGFEPVAEIFEQYETSCALNKLDIRRVPVALSNRDGTTRMRGITIDATSGTTEVPISRLDTLPYHFDRLDLMKIDVEGHEPEVLEGMGTLLPQFRPSILAEILSSAAAERVEAILDGLGYIYFDIDEVGPPRPVRHLRPSSRWNWLICQPAIARDLGLAHPPTHVSGTR